jgi:hypothetical protein
VVLAILAAPSLSPAQTEDTPALKVGVTIFADWTYNRSPLTVDADSNRVHLSQFNIGRAYINVTGNISHLLTFRVTPDIVRETGAGTSLNGSLEFRLKYAYAQLNLDDWITKGSWVRFGIQQTPWVDFEEGVYRYRFQGTIFADRETYLSSSDAGLSAKYNLPSNYGDVHFGIYNGETFSKPEVNNQKAFQVRATLRPFATAAPVLRGFRASLFYDGDHYVKDAARRRLIVAGTLEHKYLNVGAQYLKAEDRISIKKAEVDGNGISIWATPKTTKGWEGLARYDRLKPNDTLDTQTRTRTIFGIAYWLPHQGSVSSAFMLDYENTSFRNFTPDQPTQGKIALHGLVNF